MIASLTAPTGAKRNSLGGTSAIFRLPYCYAINDLWSVCGMQSVLLVDHGHNVQWQPDVLIARNLGKKAAAFAEYGGYFTSNNLPLNLIHFGASYKPTRRQEIDGHFGFGLNQNAPSAFVGCGYSFRFDGLF